MAVNRIQKGGMSAVYKGTTVKTSCSSLSRGLELIGENGAAVASFTPNDLKEMVSKSIRNHKVRKFALLADNANGEDMDLFLINPSTIIKYWDDLLSLNSTGRVELCLRSTKNSKLFLNLHADKIEKFVSKKQLEKVAKNKGYAAEAFTFGENSRKLKNHLVDGYMIKNTKKGKSYRFSVQLKCSSNRSNTNGIVKF